MDSAVKMMKKGVKENVFPGAVLLVSVNSDIVLHEAFGLADIFSRQKMTKNTIFDLASLTKPLATTLAILKLVQDGELFLWQNIGSIIKGAAKTDNAGITIEELLRHRSGLPAHRPFYEKLLKKPWDERDNYLRKLVLKEPLVYNTGTREVYSDLGFIILSFVVETLSGKCLNCFVKEQFYDLLGLADLFFIENGPDHLIDHHIDNGILQRIACTEDCPWRKRVLKGEVHDDNAWAAGGVEGHAGLFGTAADVWVVLMEIMHALQKKETKIIKNDFLKLFVEKKGAGCKLAGFDTPSRPVSSSGRYFSSSSLGHLGFTGTSFWIDPEKSVIVILFTNRVHPSRDNEKIRKFRPVIHDAIMERLRL
ncbi:MAG: serine hydrolase domain-containing protein [Thermodesulfobacteriota bacterium]|nr:serine hydrolase domain-containing protein [Thermodesulfobacteriota bacterium]